MKKANIVSSIIGMGLSVTFFVITLGFRQFRNVPIGPEFFPRWLTIGLFLCSAALFIKSIRAPSSRSPTLSLFDKGIQRMIIAVAITVAYAFSWIYLGFLVSTPLGLFGFMFLLGFRKYRLMIIYSFSATLVIFFLFSYVLNIRMPMGFLTGIL